MQMTGYYADTSVDSVVVGGMNSPLVSVFDDALLSGPYRPAEVPVWDVVCELEAFDLFELWRVLG
jgi:hypothetical protein